MESNSDMDTHYNVMNKANPERSVLNFKPLGFSRRIFRINILVGVFCYLLMLTA